ncbi:unnamed protein product [Caenorhabditis brenneri]
MNFLFFLVATTLPFLSLGYIAPEPLEIPDLLTRDPNYNCPKDGQRYLLVAEKPGQTLSLLSGNKILRDTQKLAEGVNIDFIAQCHSHHRITAKTSSGDKINLKKVSCLAIGVYLEYPF